MLEHTRSHFSMPLNYSRNINGNGFEWRSRESWTAEEAAYFSQTQRSEARNIFKEFRNYKGVQDVFDSNGNDLPLSPIHHLHPRRPGFKSDDTAVSNLGIQPLGKWILKTTGSAQNTPQESEAAAGENSPKNPTEKNHKSTDKRTQPRTNSEFLKPSHTQGAAQCHGKIGNISTLYLLLGRLTPAAIPLEDSTLQTLNPDIPANTFWSGEAPRDGLSHLISSRIISCEPDEIRVFTEEQQSLIDLTELGWGSLEKIWSPFRSETVGMSSPPTAGAEHFTNYLRIERGQWLQSDHAANSLENLSYLERRKSRLESLQECVSCRDRPASRSLLARLFRPRS